MTPAEASTVVIYTLGGQTVLLAAVGYLARRFIDSRYKQQEERFVHELSKERDVLRSGLDKRLAIFSHRHSLYSERQADSIAELYSSLASISSELSTGMLGESAEESQKQVDTAFKKLLALWDVFDTRRIYFPSALAEDIDHLLGQYMSLAGRFRVLREEAGNVEDYYDFYAKVRELRKPTKENLERIEKAFRTLLAGDNG